MTTPRKLAAGNWKMNGLEAQLAEVDTLMATHTTPVCDILLCPPATLIDRMARRIGDGKIAVGGQDCHAAPSGAHTGDVSAAMLADAGATHVILGHSERRADHGESDDAVRDKVAAAWEAGLVPVVCVGETLEQREGGSTLAVVGGQLQGSIPDGATAATLVVAYEPVWAIGTGRVPTTEQIAEVHDFLRDRLSQRMGGEGNGVSLLYGGSVKPSNAAEIFAVENVNGALVGGASLKAGDFSGIIDALEQS
ncbi:triose-phosphate isomerase [Tranquillimonas alkanivorans]|uniref:Triosephosphate isomerase n=1 Tax=Tranquillimonas alkanivorans TaxID=441119 RepID=A0A1I5MLP7_9RHOB|nr:triose-phosphate isomerase [Tranquillimonas alkanivorans]SFP10518.1 triosephosphate isomerase [Tranquillimonas alkanivorans]